MLKNAIKAGLPIITATTADPLNIDRVLAEHAGTTVGVWTHPAAKSPYPTNHLILYTFSVPVEERELYERLRADGRTLVCLNLGDPLVCAFDAGDAVTPREVLQSVLENEGWEDSIEEVLPATGGMSVKVMRECLMMTTARDGHLSRRGLLRTRADVMPKADGLSLVDTRLDYYLPSCPEFAKWVAVNTPYFQGDRDARLMPRGVLLNGYPGVGKTQAAKWLANEWQVPLYRLDVAALLDKYWGESERRMRGLLQQVDAEAPCVLLIDEIEKAFRQGDDGGVTSRLLGQLLWWLQERRSRVVVVMTTNAYATLPAELYRPGRIDAVFTINPLYPADVMKLAAKVLESVTVKEPAAMMTVKQVLGGHMLDCEKETMAHAEVVARTLWEVKLNQWA